MPDMVLRDLMAKIVGSTHNLTTEKGERHVQGTIDPKALRMAAITALQIALGEAIWPADQKIVVADAPRDYGIFRHERG